MSLSKEYLSPCIGCKLRRTRCDRRQPICSSCHSINIPAELCHYKNIRIGIKDKNSRETLAAFQKKNEDLKAELKAAQEELSHRSSTKTSKGDKISASNGNSPISEESSSPISQPQQHVHNDETSLSNLHHGSSSWTSPMAIGPQFKEIMGDIRTKMRNESKKETRIRQMMLDLLISHKSLNQVKDRLNKINVGLESVQDFSLLEELITSLEESLPDYKYITDAFGKFFRFGSCYGTFLEINAGFFWSKFHRTFSHDDFGAVKIDLKFPQHLDRVPFLVLFLAFLVFIIFENLHRTKVPFDKSDIRTNPLILTEYCKLISNVIMLYVDFKPGAKFGIHEALNRDHLQGLCQINVFDTFSNADKFSEITETSGGILNLWKIVNIAKLMSLNKNIDQVYSNHSFDYRIGLKYSWYYLVFLNISFSLEAGMTGKIKPNEVPFYPDLNTNISRALRELNQICYDFNFSEMDSHKFSFDHIEQNFINPLHKMMTNEFKTIQEKVDMLHDYNKDSPSECQSFREITVEFAIHILSINTLASIYSFCERKAKTQNDLMKLNQYKLLKLKTTMLLIKCGPATLSGYQLFLNHENSDLYSPLLSLLHLYIRLRRTYRRVGVSIASHVFQDLKHVKCADLEGILSLNQQDTNQVVDSILDENPRYLEGFSIEELEDWSIEHDPKLMNHKFQLLNDHKFILISVVKNLQDCCDAFETENYNLEFYKQNTTFRFVSKITGTLLILIHKMEQRDHADGINVQDSNAKQVIHDSKCTVLPIRKDDTSAQILVQQTQYTTQQKQDSMIDTSTSINYDKSGDILNDDDKNIKRESTTEEEFNFSDLFQRAFETTQYGYMDPSELQKQEESSNNAGTDDNLGGYTYRQ